MLALRSEVNVAVYILKNSIPTIIQRTAKSLASNEDGVRSPYLIQ